MGVLKDLEGAEGRAQDDHDEEPHDGSGPQADPDQEPRLLRHLQSAGLIGPPGVDQ